MRSALARILKDHEQRRNAEISAREAEQAGLEKFLADATTALTTVVAPCFDWFSEELKRHNHTCTIEVQEQDPGDKRSEVKIMLTIFPDHTTLPQGNPALSYTASAHRLKVNAHRSITTRSGGLIPASIGDYELAQITPALVDRHLLEWAETIFAQA